MKITQPIARSVDRVPQHTSERSQKRIDEKTRDRVRSAAQGGRKAINHRLEELDREWDIERMIELNSSSLALGGLLLGRFVNRWFLVLPAAVTAFLLQHALQGWCPPIPLLRRLGFRTSEEIATERSALKALRGDFRARIRKNPRRALRAARR